MESEVSAGAVIYRDTPQGRRFLLLHYVTSKSNWDFPKGKLEKDEQPIQAAMRETKEETGLSLSFKQGFEQMIQYFYYRGKELVGKNVYFFLAESKKESVTLSKEHIGYAWLAFDDAMQRLSFQNSREVLQKAGDFLA
jgi:8-oxo-dGTP pyrophosphatase MutT (NUDIX family)